MTTVTSYVANQSTVVAIPRGPQGPAGSGGGGGGVTNLGETSTATTVTITSSTGSSATIPAATTSNAGAMTAADCTTLAGLATVATSGSYADLSNKPALGSLAALSSVNNANWSGAALAPSNGGTGVANNAANTLTFSGNYGLTLTLGGATSLTLPASGTLATVGGALGTPASATLTNATGLPISTGLAGAGTGVLTALQNAANASGGVMTKLTVGTTATTGGNAGQLMFDTGSALSESANLTFASNVLYSAAFNASSYVAIAGATIGTNSLALMGTASFGGAVVQGDAANILAHVNGTNAQTLRVYGTSTSSNANYERLTINSSGTDYLGATTYTITPEAGGTGTQRSLTLGNATCGTNVRGYGIFLPDAGTFGSNFGYYQVASSWAWRNHTAGFPGWIISMTYNSNTISLRAGPYQSTGDAATSLVYPWAIDTGNSYFGVWQSSPAYPLDVIGDVNTTTKYRIGGNIVLAGQASGYGTPTGGSHQSSFAAGSITLPNLAACVAQLIVDLKAGNMPAT